MKNFVQVGENITVTAAAVAQSRDGIKMGNLFGVASGDAQIGEPVTLVTVGVFDMPKVGVDNFTSGAAV